MPKEGLEPSRACAQQILSLPCIPFSPLRLLASNMSKNNLFVSTIPLYFKECLLKNVLKLFSQILYARWDSNPQPRRARLLRPLCIPNSTTHAYIQRTISRPSRSRTLSLRVGAVNVEPLHQRPIFARAEGFEPPRTLRP